MYRPPKKAIYTNEVKWSEDCASKVLPPTPSTELVKLKIFSHHVKFAYLQMSLLILLEAVNLPNISNREQQASTMYHAEQNLRLVSRVKRLGLLDFRLHNQGFV